MRTSRWKISKERRRLLKTVRICVIRTVKRLIAEVVKRQRPTENAFQLGLLAGAFRKSLNQWFEFVSLAPSIKQREPYRFQNKNWQNFHLVLTQNGFASQLVNVIAAFNEIVAAPRDRESQRVSRFLSQMMAIYVDHMSTQNVPSQISCVVDWWQAVQQRCSERFNSFRINLLSFWFQVSILIGNCSIISVIVCCFAEFSFSIIVFHNSTEEEPSRWSVSSEEFN